MSNYVDKLRQWVGERSLEVLLRVIVVMPTVIQWGVEFLVYFWYAVKPWNVGLPRRKRKSRLSRLSSCCLKLARTLDRLLCFGYSIAGL